MSAKTQIDNFIRSYPEAMLDPSRGNVYVLNQQQNGFTLCIRFLFLYRNNSCNCTC